MTIERLPEYSTMFPFSGGVASNNIVAQNGVSDPLFNFPLMPDITFSMPDFSNIDLSGLDNLFATLDFNNLLNFSLDEQTKVQNLEFSNPCDKYVYDEKNYDTAAVSALEQKWSKKAKKNGLNHQFFVKLTALAKELKCDPNALLAIMNSESGLNPKAVNSHGGATGLIQFMPKTAKGLGTSTAALYNMSAVDQLDYVAKYLIGAKKRAKMGNQTMSAADLYALIFLPARANRDVLTSNNEKYYQWNKGLDRDGDGKISKADLEKRIQKFMA